MKYISRFLAFSCLCFFSCSSLLATAYNNTGNNTTNYVTTSNIVDTAARGFVFFTNGIIFDGTVNVALPVPISGNLQFGNGTTSKIILEADLTIGSTAGTSTNTVKINTSNGYAEIDGNKNTIICSSNTYFPMSRAISVLSDLVINGRGHDIVFDYFMTFSIQSYATLTICNARLRGLNWLNFVGPGTLILNNVSIILDNDWTYSGNASIGTPELAFGGNCIVSGFGKRFVYAGGQDMSLFSDASLVFDIGTTFSWACKRRNNFILGKMRNATPGCGSSLMFDNSNITSPSRGVNSGLYIQLPTNPNSTGSIVFDNACNIYNNSTTDINKSLQYDASSMYLSAGAQVYLDGYLYDANPTTSKYLPTSGSTVVVKNGSYYVTLAGTANQSAGGLSRVLETSTNNFWNRFTLTVVNPLQGSFTLTTTDGRYMVNNMATCVIADTTANANTVGTTLFYDWQGHIWGTIDSTSTFDWWGSNVDKVIDTTSYGGWKWGNVAYWISPSPSLLRNCFGINGKWQPTPLGNASVFTIEVVS